MKVVKKLPHAKIHSSSGVSEYVVRSVKEALLINKRIYGRSPGIIDVYVCSTNGEFNKAAKIRAKAWMTGMTLSDGRLVIKSPSLIEKIGRWKKSMFKNIMIHEMNHSYWARLYKPWKPYWLVEGLACHAGKNFIYSKNRMKVMLSKHKVDYKILAYRFRYKQMKGHEPKYPVWAGFTQYLISKYSLRHIMRFLDSYNKRPLRGNYQPTIRRIFKKSEPELFENYITSL